MRLEKCRYSPGVSCQLILHKTSVLVKADAHINVTQKNDHFESSPLVTNLDKCSPPLPKVLRICGHWTANSGKIEFNLTLAPVTHFTLTTDRLIFAIVHLKSMPSANLKLHLHWRLRTTSGSLTVCCFVNTPYVASI